MHVCEIFFLQFIKSDRRLGAKIRTGQSRDVHGSEAGHDTESAMDIAL